MYLTAQEIHEAKTKYFNNFCGVSNVALHATEQLLDVFSSSGRESLKASECHFPTLETNTHSFIAQYPMAIWLEQCALNNRIFHKTVAVMADVRKSLMQTAESQIRIFDNTLMSLIHRTSKTSPAEVVPVLSAMKISLETTEQTLCGVTNATIQIVESFDTEAHKLVEVIDINDLRDETDPHRNSTLAAQVEASPLDGK